MGSVRTAIPPRARVCNRMSPIAAATTPTGCRVILLQMELFVLDIVYVLGVIALFALVGVIGWGVEKL